MLLSITKNLYIGNREAIVFANKREWSIVHATQEFHYKIMGWDRLHNKPDKTHPNYLVYETNSQLSLNWVDGASKLYEWSGPLVFTRILDFIDKNIKNKKVLIHCDCGRSRAPTLGLLYLAKRVHEIPGGTYFEAHRSFLKLYPRYKPGGIAIFVDTNWSQIA